MKSITISSFFRKSPLNLGPSNKKIQRPLPNSKETVQNPLQDSNKIDLHSLQDNNIVEWKCPYCGKWHNSKPHFKTIAKNTVSVFTCDFFTEFDKDRILTLFLPDGHTFNYLCHLRNRENAGTDPLCMRQFSHDDFIVNFYFTTIDHDSGRSWNLPRLDDKIFFNNEFSIKFEKTIINHQEQILKRRVKLYKRFLLSNHHWIDGKYCPYCQEWHTSKSLVCKQYPTLSLPILEAYPPDKGQVNPTFRYVTNLNISSKNAYRTTILREYGTDPFFMALPVNLDEFYSDDAKHFFLDVPLNNGKNVKFGIRFSGNSEDIRRDFF